VTKQRFIDGINAAFLIGYWFDIIKEKGTKNDTVNYDHFFDIRGHQHAGFRDIKGQVQ